MDNLTFFSLFIIFYFTLYNPPENVKRVLRNYYTMFISLTKNKMLEVPETSKKEEERENTKYEDKYLKEIRKMKKDFEFTEEELKMEEEYTELFYNGSKELLENRIKEINDELQSLENDENEYNNQIISESKNKLSNELEEIKQKLTSSDLRENSKKRAREQIINKCLEKLKDCYIMEKTPLGNVLMIYDNNKQSFKYYSDSTIPYRYLESVGRKYVKMFFCRPIFVDMNEELKLCEEKWENEQKEKQQKEDEERKRKEESIKNNIPMEEKKKSVFAKFKSYNKEAQSGHVNTAPPPKNSIPNKKLTESQENEKILLKEKANRYTYEGKIVNFNFLKKIDRKLVDKKFATSYADFKKMNKQKG